MQLATHIPFSHILSFFYVTFGLFQRLPTTGTFIGSRKEVLQRTFCGSVVLLEKLGSSLHFIDSLHNIIFCVATFESIYLLLLVLILNTGQKWCRYIRREYLWAIFECTKLSSYFSIVSITRDPIQAYSARHSVYILLYERGQKCCWRMIRFCVLKDCFDNLLTNNHI